MIRRSYVSGKPQRKHIINKNKCWHNGQLIEFLICVVFWGFMMIGLAGCCVGLVKITKAILNDIAETQLQQNINYNEIIREVG